jgi:uncharacterized protein (TIRG00374 family)
MNWKTKKNLSLLFGIIISVILIWFLFRNIEFSKLVDALKGANYLWLAPNIILIIITMYLRAFRWKFMLNPIKHVEFSKLIAATCVGFMANNILPARLGELVRAYSLSTQDKEISKSASLATIFVERMVFDLVALLMIFGAIITYSSKLREQLELNIYFSENMIYGSKIAVIIAIAGLIFTLILAHKPEQSGHLITKYLFFFPAKFKQFIRSIIDRFSHGLRFLISIKSVIYVALITFLIWIIMGISNYFVFLAFGFDISVDASFVLLVVVSILIMAPSTPGFLGVYHYGVVISLGIYGITDEKARACALVLHAAQYFIVTLMGFYFLKKEHLSLKKLEESAIDEPNL